MTEILVRNEGAVRVITLNRPDQLNAINLEMIRLLHEAIESANADEAVNAILLAGNGRAFCAGDDVDEQSAICDAGEVALREQLAMLQRISRNLVLSPKPIVAALQGWAIGAGFSWILNADHVICTPEARAFFPEVGFGTFVTGGATWLLPQIAGRRKARELLLSGIKIDADGLVRAGIVSSVVAPDELMHEALRISRELAALPGRAVRLMKAALAASEAVALNEALDREIEACVETTLIPETLERMRASLNRTK